jgi:hypothetical protein
MAIGQNGTVGGNNIQYDPSTHPAVIGYDNIGIFAGMYNNASTYEPRFSLRGSSGNYLRWNGSSLDINGSITVTGGDAATKDYANTSSNYSASLVDAKVFTDSTGRIVKAPTTGTAGLFLGSTNMGYHDGAGTWKTYMANNGNFYLTGTNGYLTWTAATDNLQIKGEIIVTGGNAATQAGVSGSITEISGSVASSINTAISTAASNTAVAVNTLSGSLGAMAAINSINSGNATTFIGAGVIVANMFAGTAIQSTNYVAGTHPYFSQTGTFIDLAGSSIRTQGFGVDSSGNSYFSGNVTATSGTIGGWNISDTQIYKIVSGNGITIDSNTRKITFDGSGAMQFNGSGQISMYGAGGILLQGGQSFVTSAGGVYLFNTNSGVYVERWEGHNAPTSADTYHSAGIGYTTGYGVYSNVRNSGALSGYFEGGRLTCTDNIVAYYSDERLKNIIGNIPNALDKINKLNGFYYTNNELAKSFGYKDDKMQIGVSAQEVNAILPEVISLAPFDMEFDEEIRTQKSKSGENYMTVQYDRLVPILIEAIKELSNKVEKLEQKLNNK